MKLPPLSADGCQTRPSRAGQILAFTVAALFACAIVASSGCGPLGIYSLANNIAHHHVLKPVIPDEPAPEIVGDEPCGR